MTMLDEAILCAERGWYVFPCNPKTKRPLTADGFYAATRDPAVIEQWWKRWPRAMIAVRCGPESGFFAVDLDLDSAKQLDGVAKFTALQNGRMLPDTITVETPRGGRHLWFAWADGVRNSESKLAPGIDVRGQGGYVIVPPSRTADGAEYQFVNDNPDGPAQAPQWLLDLILANKLKRKSDHERTTGGNAGGAPAGNADNYGRAALERECATVTTTPPGRRNAALNAAAFSLGQLVGGSLLGESEVRDRLYAAALACGVVKDDGAKAAADTISSGLDAGMREPRTAPHAERWRDRYDDIPRLVESAESRADPPQPATPKINPIDLWAKFDPPMLPRGVLPKVIEDYAFSQGELMGADPAGLAVAGLTVCAAAIPDHVELQVKEHDSSWGESARLWIALVGDPSRKKTPILRQSARALNRIDAELARIYAEAMAAYQQLSADERKFTEPPKKKRLRIEDTTIEAAQHILKDSPNGVLSLQDELSGWFGSMEKYNPGRGSAKDRGFWLQSWNGGSYVSDRIGRGTVYIPNLSVSLIGGIQPAAMRKIIEDTVDDGLIQRLNPVMLRPATVGKDDERPDATKQYEALVTRLAEEPAPPLTIKFSPGAQAIRRKLEQRHLDLTTCEGFSAKLAAHLGKYDGIFARLCLIWHCLETANWNTPISEDAAARVERFLHGFLLPHAVAFYASMGSDNHDRLADVAGYILAHNLQVITNRDLARCIRSTKGLTGFEVRELFEALDALGWITPIPGPRPTSPTRWVVNPECHRLFAARAEAEREHRKKAREIMQEIFSKPKEDWQ
jgi:hypothetical protein